MSSDHNSAIRVKDGRTVSKGPVTNLPQFADLSVGKSLPAKTYNKLREQVNLCDLQTRDADPSGIAPVAIFWDLENCGIPSEVPAENVANNIRNSLQSHPETRGSKIIVFSAYADFAFLPRKLREGCQQTGISLLDVPGGRKDAADKAILTDMLFFAMDHPPPASILLISGDSDFSACLHRLSQRGFTILLSNLSKKINCCNSLRGAASFVWSWEEMARGQPGLEGTRKLPVQLKSKSPKNVLIPSHVIGRSVAVYQGVGKVKQEGKEGKENALRKLDKSSISAENFRGTKKGGKLGEQLVGLLQEHQGRLELVQVPCAYLKKYRLPLPLADFGASKVSQVVKQMSDVMWIQHSPVGRKFLCLRGGDIVEQTSQSSKALVEEEVSEESGGVEELEDTEEAEVGEEVGWKEVLRPRSVERIGMDDCEVIVWGRGDEMESRRRGVTRGKVFFD